MNDNQEINARSKVKSGLFYGYIIVFTCFILQGVMFGPRGSFGVFIVPLTSEFGWSRALISGAYSFSSLLQGFSSVVLGWLNDRLGPRVVITLCSFLLGSGLALMCLLHSIWQLYLFYSVLVGFAMGGIFSPQMSTVARWFVKRRNIMTGILMAGGGIGGLICPPLMNGLIYNLGWRNAFLGAGLGVFAVMIIAAQFLRRDPAQMGLAPYGEGSEIKKKGQTGSDELSLQQALHTRRYWMFGIMIFCYGFSQMTVFVHIVPHAVDLGISASAAAIILASLNGAIMMGSLVMGLIADKIGVRRVLIINFCLLFAVIFLLLPVRSAWLLGFFVVIVAFGAGGIAVIQSSTVAELFGMKSHGAILGSLMFIFALGAACGPFLAGWIFDATGNYQWAFLLCSTLILGAIILGINLNRQKQPAK